MPREPKTGLDGFLSFLNDPLGEVDEDDDTAAKTGERPRIVAFIRARSNWSAETLAHAIERGEHLK